MASALCLGLVKKGEGHAKVDEGAAKPSGVEAGVHAEGPVVVVVLRLAIPLGEPRVELEEAPCEHACEGQRARVVSAASAEEVSRESLRSRDVQGCMLERQML